MVKHKWATDERSVSSPKNRKDKPTLIYKLRKLTTQNKTGEAFGITIPRIVAHSFIGCHFHISVSGSQIILESGCSTITKNEQKNILAV